MEEQICAMVPGSVATAVGYLTFLGALNFVKAPDEVKNPVLRVVSRILHFLAFDLTTSMVKK